MSGNVKMLYIPCVLQDNTIIDNRFKYDKSRIITFVYLGHDTISDILFFGIIPIIADKKLIYNTYYHYR